MVKLPLISILSYGPSLLINSMITNAEWLSYHLMVPYIMAHPY